MLLSFTCLDIYFVGLMTAPNHTTGCPFFCSPDRVGKAATRLGTAAPGGDQGYAVQVHQERGLCFRGLRNRRVGYLYFIYSYSVGIPLATGLELEEGYRHVAALSKAAVVAQRKGQACVWYYRHGHGARRLT